MRRVLLFLGVGSLALSLACGGGSRNGGGFGSGGGTGSFTNSSLSGQYAYQLKGYALPSQAPFREAGVFTADGSGHLTSVTDDFASGGTSSPLSTTGSYQLNSDGTGTLTINFSGGNAVFAITLSSSSQLYMVEADSVLNNGLVASGTAQKQDPSVLTNLPSGTYILRMRNIEVNTTNPSIFTSKSTVGSFTVASGGTVTGSFDKEQLASFTAQQPITGALNTPTGGRGTGTFVDNANQTTTFNYYAIDANHLVFFNTNGGTAGDEIGTGVAEKQTAGPFTTASFSGPYAFAANGDTDFFDLANTVGRFNADGSGNITAGVLDDNTEGTVSSDVSFTGSYSVASNGRVAVTLTTSGSSITQVYWLVNPNRAFFAIDSSNAVQDGSLDTQVGSFSNASLSGLYAFEMDGFDSSLALTKERVGVMNLNGSGTISLGEVSNASGSASTSGTLSGTYNVGSNGRVTGSVNSLSSGLVFYLVSGSQGYLLQGDNGVSISGSMIKQP